MRCPFVLVSLFGLWPGLSWAQADQLPLSIDEIETVTVTAERHAVPLNEVGSSIEILDAQDLANGQFVFVLDALETLPGVTISQNGTFGGFAAVRIRGASSEQTLVLIDGVIVNDPSAPGGGFNFATLSPFDIERIEVLKGPQSTLYGSDAIGGVINIITKRPENGTALSGQFEGGSFATFSGSGGLAIGRPKGSLRLSASGVTSDGISKAEARDGNTEKDGYEALTLSARGEYALTALFSFSASARYVSSQAEFDGFGFATGVVDADQEGDSDELNLNASADLMLLDGRLQNRFSFLFSRIERGNFSAGNSTFAAEGERLGFAYRGVLDVRKLGSIAFGAKTEETSFETSFDAPSNFSTDSLYANWFVKPVAKLSFSAGLRLDDHERFGNATTLRVTANYYDEDSGWRFRGNYGEGFKAPSPFQLTFSCCGATAPNTELEPELSKAWEVGIEKSSPHSSDYHLSATFFRRKTRNLIDFFFASGTYENISQSRAKGIELGLELGLPRNFFLSANYTYLTARDQASGTQRARVPKSSAFAQIDWRPSQELATGLSFTYNGEESDSFGTVEDWVRLDLKASYRLAEQVEFYARIENLLDENYQDVFGFGTPSISAYAGVRLRY
jgi:vitamin B12 transporter